MIHDFDAFMTFRKIITKYFYYFYSRVNCALAPRELEKNEFTDYLQVKYFDLRQTFIFPNKYFFFSERVQHRRLHPPPKEHHR